MRHETLVPEVRQRPLSSDCVTKIQLVAEGVVALDQKVDRFRDEVRHEFRKVDRRFLYLEATVSALKRP